MKFKVPMIQEDAGIFRHVVEYRICAFVASSMSYTPASTEVDKKEFNEYTEALGWLMRVLQGEELDILDEQISYSIRIMRKGPKV